MPTEIEMKLHIPDDGTAEKIMNDPMVTESLSTTVRQTPMYSIYYDTADGALSDRRWSLRLRKEGDVFVASLKTNSIDYTGYLFSRNEWQCICPTIEKGIPLLIEQGAPPELASLVANAPIEERCRIEFLRTSGILKLPEGTLVELDIDKGTIRADGKEATLYELELELLFGDPEALEPISNLFRQKYKLDREILSKYERALRLIRSR